MPALHPQQGVSLSAHSLVAMALCPARWLLQASFPALSRQSATPQEDPFALGKSVHQLLDYQAKGYDVAPLLAMAPLVSHVHAHWAVLQACSVLQWPIVASEWPFRFLRDGFWLAGRLDRIARAPDEKVTIIDWKTGTGLPKNPATAWQTQLYLYAVWQARAQFPALSLEVPEQLQLLYVEVTPLACRLVPVAYGQADVLAFEARLAEALRLAQHYIDAYADTGEFPLPARCPLQQADGSYRCEHHALCGIH